MQALDQLIERVQKTERGFSDIRKAAGEMIVENTPVESLSLAIMACWLPNETANRAGGLRRLSPGRRA